MYSDDFILELLKCEKEIIDSPKELKEDRGNLKANFTLKSTNQNFSFYGFIRQNVKFSENFSIGLDYNPIEIKGTILLLRCNGPHGENKIYPHHIGCHIHKATASRINNGLKPEGDIEMTTEYATITDAIQYFIKIINLKTSDRQKYFPPPTNQIELFD